MQASKLLFGFGLGFFLVASSVFAPRATRASDLRRPVFSHVEFDDQNPQNVVGDLEYCRVALHWDQLRTAFQDWIPCAVVRDALAPYKNAPRESYGSFHALLRISSKELPLEGEDLFDAFQRDFLKRHAVIRGIEQVRNPVLENLKNFTCPQIQGSAALDFAMSTAFAVNASERASATAFSTWIADALKEPGIELKRVTEAEYRPRPIPRALGVQLFKMSKGDRELYFAFYSQSPYFHCPGG